MILKSIPRVYYFFGNTAFFSLVILPLLLSSCVTQRTVDYLQDESNTTKNFKEAPGADYRLKPNDELYIQIISLDEPSANIFSASSAQQFLQGGSVQPYGASLLSYTVDREGYLLLPVIGRISVLDSTLVQVSKTITKSLNKLLNQPIVSIKLVNRYVSVLGEVRNPGHYAYTQDKFTILDALGMAGDITEYGNRNEVILARNENGINSKILVDLTQSELLASNYYYIRPNDIVYVRSLQHKKFWDIEQFPYGILISAITAAILLYSVIQQ
jgi:polysaccharide export outer membrane protein